MTATAIPGLIIDSFAGGGGASLGIEWALGRSPDFAINHDADALAMHAANHPETVHLTENIWKVDPLAITKGRPVFNLWASPDCRHHSKAKGGAPVSASVRGLADVILIWAETVSPQIIYLENVEEWRQWGPLGEDGKPCPWRKGMHFAFWVRRLEALGYTVEWREIRASHYGAPTIRKRLFLVARRDRKPILWPAATHGAPDSEEVKQGALLPFRTAAHDVIDWSIPAPSIFLTKEEAKRLGFNVKRPLVEKSEARLAQGFKRHVLDRADPFLVILNHSGATFRGQSIYDQVSTVTAARDALGLVAPYLGINRFDSDGRAADEPLPTITANSFHKRPGAGGPLSVVTPFISHAQQGGRSRAGDVPLHTVCASTKDQNQVVTGFVAQHNGGPRAPTGRALDAPAASITTTAAQVQPVFAYLSALQNNTRRGDVREPLGTILARGNHHAVVAPFITSYYSEGGQDQAADSPLGTVPTRDRFSPITAELVPTLTPEMAIRARMVADFLRRHGVWDGPGEFVTIGEFIVWDIGMRMLTPRELARAQGFPEDYILAAPLVDGGHLNETAQRHKIGNSVSPYPAAAIVFANSVTALGMPDVKRRRRAKVPVWPGLPPEPSRQTTFLEAAE